MMQHKMSSSSSSNPQSSLQNSKRPRTTNTQNFEGMRHRGVVVAAANGLKPQTQRRIGQTNNIEDLMQQLSQKIKMPSFSSDYMSPLRNTNNFIADKQEKERQIGIILSQLSKKFPISDVLERKNIQELDEELAFQINQRTLPSKSEFSVQNLFTKEGLPHQIPQTMKEYMQGNNQLGVNSNYHEGMAALDSMSRNPNLMNTYSSKMNQLCEGAQIMEGNTRIFGKLKHRENKMPSTTGDKDKNWKSIVKQRKQATTIDNHLFMSPSKLLFFKSHYPVNPSIGHQNQNLNMQGIDTLQRQQLAGTPPFINQTFSKERTISQNGQNAGKRRVFQQQQAYEDSAFMQQQQMALEEQTIYASDLGNVRVSNSILRNNPDDAYIHKMANRGADYANGSPLKDNKVSESSIFNQNEDEGEEVVMRKGTIKANVVRAIFQDANSTVNINVPQAEILRQSHNNTSLHKALSYGTTQNQVLIRPEFRAQSQNGQKRIKQIQQSIYSNLPSLNEVVKMPKRLMPKKGIEQQSGYSLYNCCPQAAMVDREMEKRLSPSSLRKSIFKLNKSVEKNVGSLQQTISGSIPEDIEYGKTQFSMMSKQRTTIDSKSNAFIIKKLKTTRFQGTKREAGLGGNTGVNAQVIGENMIVVDPEKVRAARDKIFEIAKIKVESAFNPIRYDYIQADKMNVIDPNRGKKKFIEDEYVEDIY